MTELAPTAKAHEPIVSRAPTGEYVMWFTSGDDGPAGTPPVVGGKPCDCTSAAGIAACEWQRHTGNFPTYMALVAIGETVILLTISFRTC